MSIINDRISQANASEQAGSSSKSGSGQHAYGDFGDKSS